MKERRYANYEPRNVVPTSTMRSKIAHRQTKHRGRTWKDDEYRCMYPIKPQSPAAGYLQIRAPSPARLEPCDSRRKNRCMIDFGYTAAEIEQIVKLKINLTIDFGPTDAEIENIVK